MSAKNYQNWLTHIKVTSKDKVGPYIETQCRVFTLQNPKIGNLVQGEHPKLCMEKGWGDCFQQKTCNISEKG